MSDPERIRPEDVDGHPREEHRDTALSSVIDALLNREPLDGHEDAGSLGFVGRAISSASARPANPARVLLVCGSRRRCARLGIWLERSGYELDARPNIETAIDAMAADRPAVAVVPWHARDRDGRRGVQAIREAMPDDAPAVVVLCRTVRAAHAAIEAGADEVVLRPFDARVLAARVVGRIEVVRREAELRELRERLGTNRRVRPAVEADRRRPDAPDDLTGLPHRDALERALRGALAAGTSARRRSAMILVDIDRFRNINHSLGRAAANVVLQEFAQRLVRALSPDRIDATTGAGTISSMAARLGGDQFGILLSGIRPDIDVNAVIERILRELGDDYHLAGGDRVHLTVSMGVAMAPDDSVNPQELLQCAEYAMEEAAEVGGGVVRYYGASANPWTARHAKLSSLLIGARERGELTVFFQPIVETRTGRIAAAEALLRWESPELGKVSPGEFVPIAEERGLMGRIGEWVLDESLRHLRGWLDDGVRPLRMAVNVSIGQLVQERFSDKVRTILERHEIEPALLEIEISERGVLRDDPAVMEQLHAIREMGCRLAIDDFGTGNSAITYLKRFPLTTLKIDRSFVSGVTDSGEDSVITTAITAMARQLELEVVAEGVETEEQRRFLERCECGELQGFLFSPAVDAIRFRSLLDRSFGSENPSDAPPNSDGSPPPVS